MDKKVGWDDKEVKKQPRMIDIYVKPVGEYELWCEYCNSNKMRTRYLYTFNTPHNNGTLKRKGMKIPRRNTRID
jgi:hypothetical protein